MRMEALRIWFLATKKKIIDEMKLFRKNTQIKTENNTKSITTINAKIQDLQNQISQKQDLITQQDKITKENNIRKSNSK